MASIEKLKQLREETGISLKECKKALEDANDDIDKAKELLREVGKEVAEKKQDREVGEGRIEAYVHGNGKIGVLVDLRCETDFVARSDDFQELVHEIALQIASMNPQDKEELLEQAYIKDPSKTIRELTEDYIGKLGENIVVERFARMALA